MAHAVVSINGQEIPWSFIRKLKTIMGDDMDRVIDAFWIARKATGSKGIILYIQAGLRPDKNGNRFILTASKEREKGINSAEWQAVKKWWNNEVYEPKRQPMNVGSILREALAAGSF
jgi:hypothetical protein